jgi:hypothetical protein
MTMTMIVTMTGGSEDKNHAGVLLVSRLAWFWLWGRAVVAKSHTTPSLLRSNERAAISPLHTNFGFSNQSYCSL